MLVLRAASPPGGSGAVLALGVELFPEGLGPVLAVSTEGGFRAALVLDDRV